MIAETEVAEARRRDEADRAALRANKGLTDGSGTSTLAPHERGLHPDVEEDIEAMMQGELAGRQRWGDAVEGRPELTHWGEIAIPEPSPSRSSGQPPVDWV